MGKILIVEDEIDTAKVIEKRFITAGFKTLVAFDAYNATALLRKEKPELVILDLMLPAGGGITVLKNLRSFSDRRDVPVLVLTASSDKVYIKEVMDIGVEAFLSKPYDPDVLIETAKDLIHGGRGNND